jgi:hypothetical protein
MDIVADVEGFNSYGPGNATRLASNAATVAKANRNIENVVYWSIGKITETVTGSHYGSTDFHV